MNGLNCTPKKQKQSKHGKENKYKPIADAQTSKNKLNKRWTEKDRTRQDMTKLKEQISLRFPYFHLCSLLSAYG